MTQTAPVAGNADNHITQTQSRQRESYLDILRIAAACAVVMMHTVTGITDLVDAAAYEQQVLVGNCIRDLVIWCVPVFVMISGYLFLRPGKRIPVRDMLVKYCRRLVLALLIFGIPFSAIELFWEQESLYPAILWDSLLRVLTGKSWAHLWYLYMLLALYLVTPALQWILARVPVGAVAAVETALFLACSLYRAALNLQGNYHSEILPGAIYLFYYLLGYLFACRKRPEGKRARLIAAGLIVLAFLAGAASVGIRLSDSVLMMAYDSPFAAALALAIFGVAWSLEGRNQTRLSDRTRGALRWWSEMTFGVYLVHPIFLNLAYKFFGWNPLANEAMPGTVLSLAETWVVVLTFAILVTWVFRHIPPMKKYVL